VGIGVPGVLAAVIAYAIAAAPLSVSVCAASPHDAQIKADILHGLALAVTWPDSALEPGPFVIGLVGHDESDPELASLAGRTLRKRSLSLVPQLTAGAAREAQIVFISRSEQARLTDLLGSLARRPLLTVSEIDGFCEAGGMVQLRRDRNRYRLLVNRAAAERAGLRLDPQLLKVAEIVEGGD
jgi:hypothetical protein